MNKCNTNSKLMKFEFKNQLNIIKIRFNPPKNENNLGLNKK